MSQRPDENSARTRGTPRWAWWVLLFILLLTAGLRYRLLDVPLERDEGEYAYAGQLILQGLSPYENLYNMKLPGIYGAYAILLAVFGQTHAGIHLGLLVINAATVVLLFLLAGRLSDAIGGVMAAASFALLSVGRPVQGVFANAEHFVVLPAVGGLLVLLRAVDEDRRGWLLWSGLLLGLAVLMKQHGAAFALGGGVYLLVHEWRRQPREWSRVASSCTRFAAGVAAPLALTGLVLYLSGAFGKFWFWTVRYAVEYTSQASLEMGVQAFKISTGAIIGSAPLLWLLVAVGLVTPAWDRRLRRWGLFIAVLTVFSFLAICPGLRFRPHYFVLALPAAAVLGGLTISSLAHRLPRVRGRWLSNGMALALAALSLSASLYEQREFLFEMDAMRIARPIRGVNPFPESLAIADYIRQHSTENDRIAVIGSEPQIYFYSRRRSATGYVYTYALMEEHDFALSMQEEMIREIERARPRFLVFVKIPKSWLPQPNSHPLIFEWFERYQQEGYELAGLVDLFPAESQYRWAPDVVWPPSSPVWIGVFERKD